MIEILRRDLATLGLPLRSFEVEFGRFNLEVTEWEHREYFELF